MFDSCLNLPEPALLGVAGPNLHVPQLQDGERGRGQELGKVPQHSKAALNSERQLQNGKEQTVLVRGVLAGRFTAFPVTIERKREPEKLPRKCEGSVGKESGYCLIHLVGESCTLCISEDRLSVGKFDLTNASMVGGSR